MKIALLGFGLETRSAYRFLKARYPYATFEIYDQSYNSKVETPPATASSRRVCHDWLVPLPDRL